MNKAWIISGAALNVFADVMVKRWALGKNSIMFAAIAYMLDFFIWTKILKEGNSLSTSLIFWEAAVVLLGVTWVVLKEGESISASTIIGALLIIAGMVVVESCN